MLNRACGAPGPWEELLPSFPEGPKLEATLLGSGKGFGNLSFTPTMSLGSLALAAFLSHARGRDSYSLGGSPRTRLNSWPKGGT